MGDAGQDEGTRGRGARDGSPAAQETYDTGRAVMLAVVAAIGGFLFGFDTAVINGAVDAIRADFGMGAGLTGFAVSSALIGCAIGAWTAGQLAERHGRIRVMLLASVFFTVSAIGSGLARGPWDLIGWRLLGGLAVGAASVIAPAYIAEISPASIRGRLGSLQQLAIVTGIFVALLSDYFIATGAGGAGDPFWLGLEAWRWMFFTAAVPAIAYGALALGIPESPRYLVAQGQIERARGVLAQVLRSGVDARMKEIRRTVKEDARASMADLKGPALGLLPIVWIGIGLSLFQQFVGINVIFYYSSSLWQQVGFTESDALVQTVITSVTNIAVTVVAIALIDRIGRRRLLLIGSAGMVVSLGALAAAFATAPVVDGEPALQGAGGPVALVAANLFVVFFGMSWGPAVWVLLGEMFSNRIRASALGLAAAAQWGGNFLVSTTFPALAGVGLGLAYGLYTAFAALSFVFVKRFVPETRGVQLEDMGDDGRAAVAGDEPRDEGRLAA